MLNLESVLRLVRVFLMNQWYAELGLSQDATWTEVHNRYRSLMKQHHPDLHVRRNKRFRIRAEERAKRLNNAYEEIRRDYFGGESEPGVRPRPSASYRSGSYRARRRECSYYWSLVTVIGLPFWIIKITLALVFSQCGLAAAALVIGAFFYFNQNEISPLDVIPFKVQSTPLGYRSIVPVSGEDSGVDPASFYPTELIIEKPDLVEAAISCNVHAVRKLLAKGAEINSRDERGDSALAWAAKRNCIKVAEVLVRAGADSSLRAMNGFTATKWARMYHNYEIESLLQGAATGTRV